MTQPNAGSFIIKGEVKRAYNLDYTTDVVFDYVSDFKVLYSNVPYATKIQLRKNSGKARMFCNVEVLGVVAKAVVDVEPIINREARVIRLGPPAEPLGPLPIGYLTGTFTSTLQMLPNEKGGTRATARIALAFDARQVEILNFFSPAFIESAAQPLLQQRLDQLCTDYVVKLIEGYPAWRDSKLQQQQASSSL